MADLGHGRAHPLAQMGLDAVELGPLGLQGTAVREEEVDVEEDDVRTVGTTPSATESVRSTCRVS